MSLPVEVEEILAAVGINAFPTNLDRALHWLTTERRRREILATTYVRALADHGAEGAKPHADALEDSDTAIRWLTQLCADFARAEVKEMVTSKQPKSFVRRLMLSMAGR